MSIEKTKKKLEPFNAKLNEFKELNLKHEEINISNIEKLKQIKSDFSLKINDLIEKFSSIENIEKKDKDNENLNNEKDEISPASIPINSIPLMPNGTYIYRQDKSRSYTFSCPEVLSSIFEIRMKIIKSTCGYVSIGVSKTILDENKTYLGGDLGTGNIGLASNKSLGLEGKWKGNCKGFKTNDIVTLIGDNGVITYMVNDELDENFSYDMKTDELYLSFSFYYENDSIEILE